MIDITRNIVVTAENVEEVGKELARQYAVANMGSFAFVWAVSIEEEMHLDKQGKYAAKLKTLKERMLKIQNLIDRIELVKGDLEKGSNSRFHTDTTKYNYCSDAHWFIAPSYTDNNRSVWMFEE